MNAIQAFVAEATWPQRPAGDRRRVRCAAIGAALILSGFLFAGEGLWILAKAQLAQILLHRAWTRTESDINVKPWPWADTWPIARLRIPRLGSDSIVLAGASGRTLAFGPGHLDGSASPGSAGNCVISAHRDTQFAALREVVSGDEIQLIDRDRHIHSYRVRETFVVDRSDTSVLQSSAEATLTLITCYPFDAVVAGGRLRYVVVAERIGEGKLP